MASLTWACAHDAARLAEPADEAPSIAAAMRDLLDPRPTRAYLGPCDLDDGSCPGQLYVDADSPGDSITCPECGRETLVTTRRLALLRRMGRELMTVDEASTLLRQWKIHSATPASLARQLARRKIAPRARGARVGPGGTLHSVPLFAFGEIYGVLYKKKALT